MKGSVSFDDGRRMIKATIVLISVHFAGHETSPQKCLVRKAAPGSFRLLSASTGAPPRKPSGNVFSQYIPIHASHKWIVHPTISKWDECDPFQLNASSSFPCGQDCDGAHGQEINDEVRRNHGYTPGEVEELMQLFRALASTASDLRGI